MNGKFCLEDDYVYTADMNNCRFDEFKKYGSVSGYIAIAANDEDDLAAKCESNGPITICIDATNWSFQL